MCFDEALSSWHPRECSAQHSCQRQRNARLAHILRLRPPPDRDRSTALCRGTARHRVERHGLSIISSSSDWPGSNDAGSFFVTRAKSNFRAQRRYSRAFDRATGLVFNRGEDVRALADARWLNIKLAVDPSGEDLLLPRTSSPKCPVLTSVRAAVHAGGSHSPSLDRLARVRVT